MRIKAAGINANVLGKKPQLLTQVGLLGWRYGISRLDQGRSINRIHHRRNFVGRETQILNDTGT